MCCAPKIADRQSEEVLLGCAPKIADRQFEEVLLERNEIVDRLSGLNADQGMVSGNRLETLEFLA